VRTRWLPQLSLATARIRLGAWATLVLLAASSAGCGGAGQYTWYSELPQTEWGSVNGEYVIEIGDTISIHAYEQKDVSATQKVRRDGRLSLPLAGEVMAAGKHPSQLAREIEGRLKEFIVTPRVTVNIESSQPVTITSFGEVSHVGLLTLEAPGQLVQALAQAGGPNDYANRSRIFIMRQFPTFRRIRFTYDAVLHNEGGAATFPLHTGDVLVIE